MPLLRPAHTVLCLIIAVATGWHPVAQAVEDGVCPERPPLRAHAAKPRPPAMENPPTDIRARQLHTVSGGVSEFSGNVEMQQGNQHLTAEQVRYDQTTGLADATGNVMFQDTSGASFQTQETHINLESRLGYAGPSYFRLENAGARGDAERIDFEGPDHTRLTRVRYTTCAPGQDSWFLKMRELNLDTQEDIGTAYHASVDFQGVPIFYLPYLSFPISDQRKSGFLIPRVGNASNRGLEVAAPYYFNLAPNYDDTLTPQFMSERGLQLQNQFRYLTQHSEGKLEFEILQNDRLANGDNRAAGTYQHKHVFSPLWSGNIDVRAVSDKKYFDDFGDDLAITSQTHLPQNAGVDYRGPLWNFSARAADYQTIDSTIAPTDRPYARLPQLNFSTNIPVKPNSLNYYFESEAVNFERNVGVVGERLNLSPSMSLPLENSFGFVTPRFGVRQIAYHLSGTQDDTPFLTRGVFSLDSGLVFERDSRWGERLYTQTLEPRLYYLYIPAKGQDGLPNFDTGVPDLSFSNLFRDNRFTGGDRIGDSNQITAAVTTRFIDEKDGAERGRASIGRIYYLAERQVNLPAGPSGAASSDIVGEAAATLAGHWHARSTVQWNRVDDHIQKYNYYLQYNPAKNRIVNVGKRFSRGDLEQTDISTEWPIAGRWTFRARSLYSQRDNRNVDSYAGMEYNACCWALRILGSRRLLVDTTHDNAATQNSSIMLELELTGLSKLGHIPDSPLRQSMFSSPSQSTAPGATIP
ncbi:LPS-assembly protein LptD [Sulfuricaulis sp.]|jgi:LPS-assembly protein|uniref:LPS-assembly protein LptD n=1 Tax=Sulfuricaulis sp. TaxID=2003553 RepID=UPI003559AD65